MFSDGSQSHFWELWAGEYLLFCQCTRCGTRRRRSELFFCYIKALSQGLFWGFFWFFSPLFVSLARCTDTAFKSDRKVFNRDEVGRLRVERLQGATRWLLKTCLKHQRRRQRRQTREVSSEGQKKRERVAGGWWSLGLYTWFLFFLGYTDSVGDWSSVFGLISWTLVRIFFWCPAKDTPILWRSLQHTETKTGTLMWLWRKCSLSHPALHADAHVHIEVKHGAKTEDKISGFLAPTYFFKGVTKKMNIFFFWKLRGSNWIRNAIESWYLDIQLKFNWR